jgi:carboxyl-terminal processing protease
MRNSYYSALFFFLFILLPLKPAQAFQQFPCGMIHTVSNMFLEYHIVHNEVDGKISERISNEYLSRLDPQKIYLLKGDVKKIKRSIKKFLTSKNKPDCENLEMGRQVLENRISNGFEHAKKFLNNKKYKLDKSVKIQIDRKKMQFPSSKSESEKRQDKYLHFQMANYISSDMKVEKARDKLIHKIELNLNRIKKMKGDRLYSIFLDSFAGALDPHSSFFDRDALEDFQISMNLELEGIGAVLTWEDGYTVVRQLVTGGAAERAGTLEVSDKILAVGQGKEGELEDVVDQDLRDVVKLIRGKKGTKVKLSILRAGDKAKRLEVILVRDKIKLTDEAAKITYKDIERDGKKLKIGKIDLPSFYADTGSGSKSCTSDVRDLLIEAKKKKVDGIVLDLSKNGGGVLKEAVGVAGLFIKTGNVVAVKASDGKVDTLEDDNDELIYNGPLAIMTSPLTASASEIVAGALRDYGRAVIVGSDHTFGKGSVQTVVHVPYQLGGIKVTSGMYFVPGGKSTQHGGIKADILLPYLGNFDDIGEKSLDYSLPSDRIKPFLSSSKKIIDKEPWGKVTNTLVKKIKKKSEKRIASSKELKELKKKHKKDKDTKYIYISDLFNEENKKDKKELKTEKQTPEKLKAKQKDKTAKKEDKDEVDPEDLFRENETYLILADMIKEIKKSSKKNVANIPAS